MLYYYMMLCYIRLLMVYYYNPYFLSKISFYVVITELKKQFTRYFTSLLTSPMHLLLCTSGQIFFVLVASENVQFMNNTFDLPRDPCSAFTVVRH